MAAVNQPEDFLKRGSGPESGSRRQRSVREIALGEALSAAQKVSDPVARAEALAAIASHVPDAEREASLEEAVRAAREALTPARAISDPLARAKALAAIALHLPDAEREASLGEAVRAAREALTPARAISDPLARAKALAAIALHLPDAEREASQGEAVRAAREALTPARAISDPLARAKALTAVASHLPDAEREAPLEEAVCAARRRPLFGRESDRIRIDRAAALIGLARLEREAAPDAALDAVRRISNNSDRARLSLILAARLRDGKREEALRVALDAARTVHDRTSESARLIPRSAAEVAFWAALTVARAILDARERADVLVSLALLAPKDELKDENHEVDGPDENERRQCMSEFTQLLDDQLRMFEASGEWRLSLPAKVTIQQGFISLTVDTLGMGEITQPAQRDAAVGKALETLPGFLRHLVNIAKPLAEDAEKRNLPNTRMIGGILVLQHLKTWASMFGCSCWPD
jgi:hypothetical protein